MSSRRRGSPERFRVGRVSVYPHHGAWWVYYRDVGRPVRQKVALERKDAEQIAAQINSQLASGAPLLLSFSPTTVAHLREIFLGHHEFVLKSSVATIQRYRAATQHLEGFTLREPKVPRVHEVRAENFVRYLREIQVAPNGHRNTKRRNLRDKGIQFILETCRAMYGFAAKQRHLPPYMGNPFAALPLDRLKIEDSKPIFLFDSECELAFLRQADAWGFPIHFTLAKTGMRSGELCHLLIEEVDLGAGWLHVRNKTSLGWRVKTGNERSIPLLKELVALLRVVIANRKAGPVFLRQEAHRGTRPILSVDRREMERICQQRQQEAGVCNSRRESLRIARSVWRDVGAIQPDTIRTSFLRIAKKIGKPEATCPKSWRHTFATLLQDANVDPLIRQITLGHAPTTHGGLGMTAHYTHTRPETQKAQIEAALRHWPLSLALVQHFMEGVER